MGYLLNAKMWGYVRGIGFTFLLFISSTFGTIFLLTPLLPLLLVVPRTVKTVIDFLIWLWKLYLVAIYECIFATKVKCFGDLPDYNDCNLIIMNHRTRFDWLYLFSYQVRFGSIKRYSITLKNILKLAPGVGLMMLVFASWTITGWAMQMAGFIFLERKWEADQVTISRCIKLYKEINFKPQILLFPEGTDLTKHTKWRSDLFAEKSKLPKYDFVLHPRTTGFTHIVQEMKKEKMLDSVIDITIAYPYRIPQNESDIMAGNFPAEIHFYAKSYPNKTIPENKDDLDTWCCKQWKQKEKFLSNFYEKKSSIKDKELKCNEDLITSLFVTAWFLWTLLEISALLLLWFYPLLWFYVILCSVFYIGVSFFTPGFGMMIASALKV